MVNNLLNDLLNIGLTVGEAKVYLALCELGSSSVGPIVKKAKISSSNVYDILNRLLDKGIASYIIKSKIKYFQSASPHTLLEFLQKKESDIQEQKESLTQVIPKIEKLQQLTTHQKAEIFFGIRGLKSAYQKHFTNKNKENIFFYIHKKSYAKESDLLYFSIVDLYQKHTKRGIVNELSRKSPWFKKVKKINFRFADFPIPGNIDICEDSVLLVSWENTITSVLIQSTDMANNLRTYFNEVWKVAKP